MKRLLCILFAWVFVYYSFAQDLDISGRVTNADDGTPLPGVSILIKGTTIGIITDIDGYYSISTPQGSTLVFQFIGMKSQEVIFSGQTVLDIILEPDIIGLDEVVVTALGLTRQKKALGYSVTELNSEDIIESREENIISSLSGKVPGVYINNTGGMAGSAARIVIRGEKSFDYNNQPLFIIDRIPFDNSEHPFDDENPGKKAEYGGTAQTGIDIDPNQIKSISVLKGASAAALYGARAANGAVIITTKSGSESDRPKITFSSSYGWENIIEPQYQKKYGQGEDGVYFDGEINRTNLIWGPRLDTTNIPLYNHFDEFFRTGSSFENSISIQGGNENSNYYSSFSRLNQNGTVPVNDLTRNNFLIKFSTDITEKLKLDFKFGYINTENNRLPEGGSYSSVMWTILNGPVTYNFLPSTGEDGIQRIFRGDRLRNNHMWTVDNVLYKDLRNRFTPSFGFDYEFLPWLRLTGIIGMDYYNSDITFYENAGNFGDYPEGRLDQTHRTNKEVNSDIMLVINKRIKDFNVNFLLGHNLYDAGYNSQKIRGTNFLMPGFYDIDNTVDRFYYSNPTKYRLFGVYNQTEVSYKEFLFLTLTERADWSSTLPYENNPYFYPSASLSFIFTEMIDIPNAILTFGKVRTGYTEVGNDAPLYATKTTYIPANPKDNQEGNIEFPFDGIGSFRENNVKAEPDLKPEKTKSFEIGGDLRFLKNRLGIDITYYNEKSINQIFTTSVAVSTGYSSIVLNDGEISNKGIELQIYTTPVKISDFEWDIILNYTKNVNKVNKISIVDNINLGGVDNSRIQLREGYPYGVIWGKGFIKDENENLLIDDLGISGLTGYPLVNSELSALGSVLPVWTGSVRNVISYKGLRLSALVDVRVGGKLINFDEYYAVYYGSSVLSEDRDTPKPIEGIKISNGEPNDIPVDLHEYLDFISDAAYVDEFWVQRADYIKLREVNLSYKLPGDIISKLPMENIMIRFTGRNLWMKTHDSFTGSDPELSIYGSGNAQGFIYNMMPAAKSYTFSLNITF